MAGLTATNAEVAGSCWRRESPGWLIRIVFGTEAQSRPQVRRLPLMHRLCVFKETVKEASEAAASDKIKVEDCRGVTLISCLPSFRYLSRARLLEAVSANTLTGHSCSTLTSQIFLPRALGMVFATPAHAEADLAITINH